MDEQDLKQIESMMFRVVGVFAEDVQHKLDILAEGQQMLAEKMDLFRTELKTDIGKVDHRLTVVEARLDQKINKQGDRFDGLENCFDGLDKKVDGIAADLSAHRRDTEAHRRGWRVREDDD